MERRLFLKSLVFLTPSVLFLKLRRNQKRNSLDFSQKLNLEEFGKNWPDYSFPKGERFNFHSEDFRGIIELFGYSFVSEKKIYGVKIVNYSKMTQWGEHIYRYVEVPSFDFRGAPIFHLIKNIKPSKKLPKVEWIRKDFF